MGTAGLDGTCLMKETAKTPWNTKSILAPDRQWIFMANHTHTHKVTLIMHRNYTGKTQWEDPDKSSVKVTTKT